MIKNLIFIIGFLILSTGLKAQCSFDPAISGASIIGVLNPSDDGIYIVGYLENHFFPNTDDENNPVIFEICLNNLGPIGGVPGISGTIHQKFTWVYDGSTNCFTGTQNQDIAANESGTVEFEFYQITQFTCPSIEMSIAAKVIPPICAINNNPINDSLTIYTCVQCLDFITDFDGSNISCGQNKGFLNANTFGGDGNFSYQWSNGSNSPGISNLSPGTHTVTVTDGKTPSCFAVYNPIVSFNEEPVIDWSSNFGGTDTDIPYKVIQVSDGDYLAVGLSGSINIDVTGNNGAIDFWVTKVDATGNLVWARTYGGSLIDVANDVVETNDGGFIIVGRSASSDGDVSINKGNIDVWVVKINNLGIIEWEKSLGGTGDDIGYSIIQTLDKGYIVGGSTTSSNGDVSSNNGAIDAWIVKLDQQGNIIWEKTYGGAQNEHFEDIKQTKGNGYICAGNTDSGSLGTNGADDFLVIKLDVNGNLEWLQAYGGTLDDRAQSIDETLDGGYITGGFTVSFDGDIPLNKGKSDYCIMRLDPAGNLLWVNTYGGLEGDIMYDLVELIDGTYVAIGFTDSSDGDITENNGGNDVWIFKIDDTGAILWEESFGGTGNDEGYSIQLAQDGGFVFTGSSRSSNIDLPANYGLTDFWIAKLSAPLALSLSCNVLDSGTGNNDGIVEYIVSDFTPPYTLEVNDPNNISYSITNQTSTIDTLNNLIPGSYVLEVTDALGCIATCSFEICDLQVDLFVNNTTCKLDNGSIIATITGGDGNYSVLWSNGSVLTNLNNLPKGNYSVTITDGSGCSAIASTVVSFSEEPAIVWEKNYGGTEFEYGYSFDLTDDGGYILAGFTASNNIDVSGNNGGSDFWVVKTDASGNLQWQKALGGTQIDISYEVHQTTDGGYIAAGSSGSNDGDVGQNKGLFDYWVVKLNSIGNIEWEQNYGGSGDDVARAIIPTNDGYVIGGYADSGNGDMSGNYGARDFWILKIDELGTIEWENNYGGSGDDLLFSLIPTKDGGYFATGQSDSNDNDVTGANGAEDIWAIKISSTGALQWQIALGGSLEDKGQDCVQTNDGGFLIQGQTLSSDGNVSINKGGTDYWLVKLNANGSFAWEKTFGGSGFESGLSILSNDANEIYISGGAASSDGDVSTNIGLTDYWVLKLDNTGGIIWEKSFGGTSFETCHDIGFAHDGDLLFLGYSFSNNVDISSNNGNEDFWFVKLDYTSFTIGLDSTVNVCFGETDGIIDVSVSGGTPPYTYNWSNGATTEIATGLSGGAYIVTVTDAESCSDTYSTAINEAPELTFSVTGVTNAGCTGNSGQATVSLTGWSGIESEFFWSNGYNSSVPYIPISTATGLSAGTYTVTITDIDYNCTTVATVVIPAGSDPVVTIDTLQEIDCNANFTGILGAIVSGASPPISYNWSNGSTTQNISNLGAGTYSLTITDGNGCVGTSSTAILSEPPVVGASISLINPISCNGGSDGSAQASVSGGIPPYSYSWSNGSLLSSTTGLSQGSYQLTTTDSNGCSVINNITINEPPQLSVVLLGSTDASCAACIGTADIQISGGTAPYSFLWSNGASTQNTTNLCAGTNAVTVTDNNGCNTITSVIIGSSSSLMVSNFQVNSAISCTGICDGVATVTPTGGQPPYSYIWTAGQTTASASGLCAGTNQVTITDSNGCTVVSGTSLIDPSNIGVTVNVLADVICFGDATGALQAIGTGGTSPYTFAWDTGATTAAISNLPVGIYVVTIFDSNNCNTNFTAQIQGPAGPISVAISNSAVGCTGGSDGSATATGTGGASPYSYTWSNGANTATVTGLSTTTYTVTVTDANNCTTTSSTSISGPASAVSATIINSAVNCIGGSDGSATATGTGGTSPYSYTWSNGANTATATGLSTTTYTVTVTDSNNCTATATTLIPGPASSVSATITNSAVGCVGGSDGSATATATGGTSPYNYTWSNGANTATATGLSTTTYTVTVTDANNCTTTASTLIQGPASTVSVSITNTTVGCNGGSDGSTTATGIGGTPPYSYEWTNGATTATITGLSALTYTITVTDNNSCTTTGSVSISEPMVLTSSVIDSTTASCGACVGTADLEVVGGTPPYFYLWSNGVTSQDPTGLCPGMNTVTVTDGNGCTTTSAVSIGNIPGLILNSITANSPISCSSICDGAATVLVSGGQTPYTYNWSNGATVSSNTGLCAGSYQVTVTDLNGCSVSAAITFVDPPVIGASININNDVSCYGGSDGAASVTASGGTTPYSYNWSDGTTTPSATNLLAGSQSVTVTDNNGCQVISALTISQPDSLDIILVSTTDASCSSCIGTADISVSGGMPPYTFTWSNGTVSEDVTNLCSGVNTVLVIDALGCSKALGFNIGNSTTFGSVSILTTNPINCTSTCEGSVQFTVSGGQLPYTYLWSNSQTNATATGLCAGTYNVTATDGNGCLTGGTITLTEPDVLGVVLTENGFIACNGAANGSITATVTGGTLGYSYIWNNGETNAAISGLTANTYTVTVSDANSCETTASISLSEPSLLTAVASEDAPASCSGNTDGAGSVVTSGGISPYSYQWTNGATTSSTTSLLSGTNSVTVTDANGCVTIDVVVISSSSGPSITGITAIPSTCGNSDGQVTIIATGGGGFPLIYSINGGTTIQSSNVFSNLPAQFYTVQVSDNFGCVETDTITVTDAPWSEAANFTFGNPNCGQQNGFIDITVPPGNAPFLYSIDNGSTTQSTPLFNGLSANSYQIVIYDVNNCTIDTTVTLQTIAPPVIDSIIISRPICGMDNGEIDVFASLGSTPYLFSIDNGVTYQPANLFNNLSPATYTILLKDANDCVVSSSATLVDIPGPQLTFLQGITPTYCGQSVGQIIISANGGTPPLQYSIDGGATIQLADSFGNLAGGIYNLYVTDDNGCAATKQVTLPDLDGPELAVAATVPSACGQSNGSVTLAVVNNGVAPFEYKEINGVFTSNNVFNNLPQGTYEFVVKDSKNCFDTLQVVLTDLPGPVIDQILSDDPSCNNNNGSITIAVSGPSAPFQYSIDNGTTYLPSNVFNNLSTGAYDIVVLDTRGCTASSQIILTDIGIPSIDSLTVLEPACNNNNGEVTLYASGGNPPLLYSLDGVNFQISNVFTNLPAGPQTFYVFDATACQKDTVFTLNNLTGPTLDSIGVDQPDCGMNNGIVSLFGSGGNPPYGYSIDNGASFTASNVFANLVPSTYLVVIKDDRDCEVSGAVQLQNQSGPQIDSIIATPSDCSSNTGSLITMVSGGTPAYTYIWNTTPVQTTATATGLAAGQYLVTISDANNCFAVGTGTVAAPVPGTVDLGPDVSFCGAQGTLLDAGPGLSYQWSTGATSQTITVSTVDVYSVTVTDFSNCVSSDSISVTEIPFNPMVTSDTTILIGESVQLQASGGMQYEWWPGTDISCSLCPDPVATAVDSVTYYVEISATSDCVDTLSVHIDVFDLNNPTIEPPTVISPNGDGINDLWVIPNIQFYPGNRVIIVNRWGDVVYESFPYNNDWGGTYKGKTLPQGTYYYYLELDVNKVDTQTGSLTILR